MQLVAHQPIVLKQSTAQSSALPPSAKAMLPAGVYTLTGSKPSAAGHWSIQFPQTRATQDGSNRFFTWLVFNDERVTLPHEGRSKALKVAYASQLDNKVQPHRTCNTSCHWMLLNFLKPGVRRTDDDYWRLDVNPLGDTTDHGVHTRALARHGIRSVWRTDLDFKDIHREIDRGIPVPMGILHRGPQAAPRGGHIILAVGYNDTGLICHDPYGKLPYSDYSSGESVLYSYTMLSARWLENQAGAGWGRIVVNWQ